MANATNVAELVDTAGDVSVLTELRQANKLELITGAGGVVWINVDGVMLLRVATCSIVHVDTTNALSTDLVL